MFHRRRAVPRYEAAGDVLKCSRVVHGFLDAETVIIDLRNRCPVERGMASPGDGSDEARKLNRERIV